MASGPPVTVASAFAALVNMPSCHIGCVNLSDRPDHNKAITDRGPLSYTFARLGAESSAASASSRHEHCLRYLEIAPPTCSIIFSPAASHKSRRNWKCVLVIATFVCPKPPRSRAWRLAPPDFAFLGGSSNTVYRAAPRRAFTAQASPKGSAETA